jgi:hypothetical protein
MFVCQRAAEGDCFGCRAGRSLVLVLVQERIFS